MNNKIQYKIQTHVIDSHGVRWVDEDEFPWLDEEPCIEQCMVLQHSYKDLKFRVVKEEVIYYV